MRVGYRDMFAKTAMAAAAAVLTAAVAAPASAQVPVQKQRTGSGTPTTTQTVVRVDTVYVDRVMTRVDTVFRTDTIQTEVVREVPLAPAGMSYYWGVGGGAAVPSNGLDNVFDTGYNASLRLGWRSNDNPFGVRFEGMYNQFKGKEIGGVDFDAASTWGVMANAVLDFPWNVDRSSAFYLTGGVGAHGFNSFDIDEEDIDGLINDDVVDEPDLIRESTTNFGVNAGVGLRFGVGGSNLFLEGRWVNVFTDGTDRRYFPITLGITF